MDAFSVLRFSAQSKGSGAGLSGFGPAADGDKPNDLGPVAEPMGAPLLTCERAVIRGYFNPGVVMRMRYYIYLQRLEERHTPRHHEKSLFMDSDKSPSQMGPPRCRRRRRLPLSCTARGWEHEFALTLSSLPPHTDTHNGYVRSSTLADVCKHCFMVLVRISGISDGEHLSGCALAIGIPSSLN